MDNLTAIVKATRASASALAAQQRQARKLEDLHAQLTSAIADCERAERIGPATARAAYLKVQGIEVAIEVVTRARRAAHRRWTNAQAVLAANALPGDAK